jgi:hypothetical protein
MILVQYNRYATLIFTAIYKFSKIEVNFYIDSGIKQN